MYLVYIYPLISALVDLSYTAMYVWLTYICQESHKTIFYPFYFVSDLHVCFLFLFLGRSPWNGATFVYIFIYTFLVVYFIFLFVKLATRYILLLVQKSRLKKKNNYLNSM